MPGQGRLGDKANVPLDAHGCPACPHPAIGPAIQGSPDVNVNRRPALRVDDPGIHAACCGTNTWTAASGSLTVFVNGKSAHRMGDETRHCGGSGQLIEGSPNVMVGESTNVLAAASRQASVQQLEHAPPAAGPSSLATAAPKAPAISTSMAAIDPASGPAATLQGADATQLAEPAEAVDAAESAEPDNADSTHDPELDLDPATLRVQAQANTLRAAAAAHLPFCEACERASQPSQASP